jgi:hypothetical protein
MLGPLVQTSTKVPHNLNWSGYAHDTIGKAYANGRVGLSGVGVGGIWKLMGSIPFVQSGARTKWQ